MSLVGGDAPALFSFANQLRARRQRIAAAAARLGAVLEQAHWVGPDRDRFVSSWQSQHAPALRAVCDDLDSAAGKVTRHAQAQENASR
ncbi:MAG: hypothetical protein QM733_05470 [Ilumatobacteraceae bacterium]